MASEVEWRRRQKPGLRATHWEPLAADDDDQPYLFKSHFTEDSYEILITDTIVVWYESVVGDTLKKRAQKLNPSVEAPVSKLLDHIKENLDEKKKHTSYSVAFKDIEGSDGQRILLSLNTKLAGLPFVWKFSGSPAARDMIAEHMTVPMLTMIGELERRQQELFKILKNKDKEINDLKSQGARVSRKHLETGLFDDVVFRNNMSSSKGFADEVRAGGASTCSEANQQLYRDIMWKHSWLHRDRNQDGDDVEEEEYVEERAAGGATGNSWSQRVPPSLAASASPKKSPARSPATSPTKSPQKAGSPTKDPEIERRQALEKRLVEQEEKKDQKKKKKKLKI